MSEAEQEAWQDQQFEDMKRRIAELEQYQKDCNRDLGKAMDKIQELEAELLGYKRRIEHHNRECLETCELTHCGYSNSKRTCPNCPKDWAIDAPEGGK